MKTDQGAHIPLFRWSCTLQPASKLFLVDLKLHRFEVVGVSPCVGTCVYKCTCVCVCVCLCVYPLCARVCVWYVCVYICVLKKLIRACAGLPTAGLHHTQSTLWAAVYSGTGREGHAVTPLQTGTVSGCTLVCGNHH